MQKPLTFATPFLSLVVLLASGILLSACSEAIPQKPSDPVELQDATGEIPYGSPTSLSLSEEGTLNSGNAVNRDQSQQNQNSNQSGQGAAMPQYDPASITELSYQEIQPGTGDTVEEGDTVAVHYTGQLPNGQVFDSSIPRNQPFVFTVGGGQVIQGWELGLIGMKEGGKRRLLIPANLGYGENGIPGAIPANSPLIFEIELINIQ